MELWVAGHRVDLGPAKQRTVLAALLVEPDQVVPTETLIGRVWDAAPPAGVRNVLYTYVARLRRILQSAGAGAGAGAGANVALRRQPGGYRLDLDRDYVDLHRFERLLGTRGAGQGQTDGERAVLLAAAAGLWRGTPLAGLPGGWAARFRERLERQRLDLLVERADVEMRLGRPEVVIEELRDAHTEWPLSELLLGRLLRALYRAGRGAEALDCYATARERFVEEIGAEPGPALRRIHEAILHETPLPVAHTTVPAPSQTDHPGQAARATRLGGPTGVVRATGAGEETGPSGTTGAGGLRGGLAAAAVLPGPLGVLTSPNSLPTDLLDFTGRDEQIEAACRALAPGTRTATAVAALVGGAGLGKTALAVHLAHRLRGAFPDGQLYLDLRGLRPDFVEPGKALQRLLRALGATAVPDGPAERAEMYRNLLADRRILVVLDDADDEAQVEPLLPGSVSSGVLVTSRSRLPGLPCTRLHLGPLRTDDAVELLARIAGADRVAAEPEASRAVVSRCEGLPLAVRIAGTRLVARPHWTVARLLSRLDDERHRLDELAHGTLAVRASIDLSYTRLDPPARQLLRRLALLDPSDLSADRLLGDVPGAEDALDRLVDAQLLDITAADGQRRYRLTDLIRIYALDRAAAEEPADPAAGAANRIDR
jgi:DNA-binding SARP family transcriptional activator